VDAIAKVELEGGGEWPELPGVFYPAVTSSQKRKISRWCVSTVQYSGDNGRRL
jgi:hypothetical protein